MDPLCDASSGVEDAELDRAGGFDANGAAAAVAVDRDQGTDEPAGPCGDRDAVEVGIFGAAESPVHPLSKLNLVVAAEASGEHVRYVFAGDITWDRDGRHVGLPFISGFRFRFVIIPIGKAATTPVRTLLPMRP